MNFLNDGQHGPWAKRKVEDEVVTISLPVYGWILPEETVNCSHSAFYYVQGKSFPICEDCGAWCLPQTEPIVLDEPLTVSRMCYKS